MTSEHEVKLWAVFTPEGSGGPLELSEAMASGSRRVRYGLLVTGAGESRGAARSDAWRAWYALTGAEQAARRAAAVDRLKARGHWWAKWWAL